MVALGGGPALSRPSPGYRSTIFLEAYHGAEGAKGRHRGSPNETASSPVIWTGYCPMLV